MFDRKYVFFFFIVIVFGVEELDLSPVQHLWDEVITTRREEAVLAAD